MRPLRPLLCLLLLLLASCAPAQGFQRSALHLRGSHPPSIERHELETSGAHELLLIVRFSSAAHASAPHLLLHAHVEVLGYVPHDALLVRATRREAVLLHDVPGVIGVHRLRAQDKVSDLAEGARGAVVHLACASPACRKRFLEHWSALRERNSELAGCHARAERRAVHAVEIACDAPVPHLRDALLVGLGEHTDVLWLEALPAAHAFHIKAATSVLTGRAAGSVPAFPLRGDGEVIGLSDSGVDTASCFFADPANAVTPDAPMPAHRKLALYSTVQGDAGDVRVGHGTASASAMLGSCFDRTSPLAAYDGLAPSARLAFVDIAVGSNVSAIDSEQAWDLVYAAGARVHLDNWGHGQGDRQSAPTAAIDRYAWLHPDLLFVRPAGNAGPLFSTLTTEATAKNALTVGASYNALAGCLEAANWVDFNTTVGPHLAHYCAAEPANCLKNASDPCDPLWAGFTCPQALQDIYNAMPRLWDSGSLVGFSSKGPTADGRIKPDLVAPGVAITAALAGDPANPRPLDTSTLSGNVVYANGTSLAAAFAAAAAALVRQYLRSGSHSSGVSIAAPPASLLKALLINTATPLDGMSDFEDERHNISVITDNDRAFQFGNSAFGFGRVDLSRLPFNSSDPPLLLTQYEQSALATGEEAVYCFEATGSGGAVLTLVWTDLPALPIARLALVSDLDLTVISDQLSAPVYGNGNTERDWINNVEHIRLNLTAGERLRVTVSAFSAPLSSQNYSLVVRGPLAPSALCIECVPNLVSFCNVSNGVGLSQCSAEGFTGDCDVLTCDSGYLYSSWRGRCLRFTDSYVILAVATAFFALLAVLLPLSLRWLYLRRRPRLAQRREHGDLRAGFWEMFAIFNMHYALLITAAVLGVLGSGLTLAQPLIIGEIYSRLTEGEGFGAVAPFLLILLGLLLAELALTTVSSIIGVVARGRVIRDLRVRMYIDILRRDYYDLLNMDMTELQARVSNDADSAVDTPCSALSTLASAMIQLVLGAIMVLYLSWKLALVLLAVVLPILYVSLFSGGLLRPRAARILELTSKTSALVYDALTHFHLIKLACSEEAEARRLAQVNSALKREQLFFYLNLVGLGGYVVAALQKFAVFAVLCYGASQVVSHQIPLAMLITFMLYLSSLTDGISSIGGFLSAYRAGFAGIKRTYEIHNLHGRGQHAARPKSGPPLPPLQMLSLARVSATYADRPSAALEGLSANFAANRVHAVVGPSGAGKSTVLKVIAGLHPLTGGAMMWNNAAVSLAGKTDFVYMHQQPVLFKRTLRENIVYNAEGISETDIQEALGALNLLPLVNSLPKGLDTLVDSGEAQRIVLIRTLLAPGASLALLDEPTSELDAATASAAVDFICRQRAHKTIVWVTHDLRAVEKADEIHFVQNGRVAESGSFDALLVSKGLFYQFLKVSYQIDQQTSGDSLGASSPDVQQSNPALRSSFDIQRARRVQKNIPQVSINT